MRDPSADFLAKLEARIASEVRPVARLRPLRLTLLLTGIALATAAMGLGMMLAMMGSGQITVGDVVVLAPAILVAAGAFLAATRLATPAAAPPRRLLVGLGLAPIGLLLCAGAVAGSLHFEPAQLAAGGTGCLWTSLAFTIAPLAAALFLLRSSWRVCHWVAGVAVGVASAILGALGTHLLCGSSECGHLLLLHFGAIVMAAVLGGLTWGLLARRAPRT